MMKENCFLDHLIKLIFKKKYQHTKIMNNDSFVKTFSELLNKSKCPFVMEFSTFNNSYSVEFKPPVVIDKFQRSVFGNKMKQFGIKPNENVISIMSELLMFVKDSNGSSAKCIMKNDKVFKYEFHFGPMSRLEIPDGYKFKNLINNKPEK